ncbi:5-methylthioadenosine/S-adenosylhomocysteine deaminase [Syntrophobotulus glycolicus DSM 8271]|uniref:5-methylthioadenosine/S-adenosylhomocysteine deaminase n=1 Tax=Syntrophobotulus glycolicus (strain DSM 8271 / FlGlyR) TaxID=645991 RepID=F0SUE6_SYNGF|nr:amidohydrolase [Syntrophobotulus glycolicus]ADY56596.1 5-methylthioadenosine/S-adenosylhomocysteine deaminase [Syntrophobotulus glycolicus DSM 8271]
MAKYLIRGMVLPMTGEHDFYPQGEIAVENDFIISVGPRGSKPDGFEPDQILDLQNDVIMPGLINTHTHAAMTMLRGYADDMPLMPWLEKKVWPFEEKLQGEDVYWGSKLAFAEMIKSGTTAMADMYFFMEDVARAVIDTGIRAVLARGIVALEKETGLRSLKNNIELFEKYHGAGAGRIKVYFGPHAPYTCPGDVLRTVKKEADRLGTGIHIHLAETLTEVETIKEKYGLSPAKWLEQLDFFGGPVLAAHCVHLDEEEMDILRKNDVAVAHNPESNMKLNSGAAPVKALLDRGILVGIGTDGTSSNNDLDMFSEIRTASFLQKLVSGPEALPAYTVLKMATVDGAKALGLDKVGMLKPGYKADLISVDFDQPHFYPRFSVVSHLVYCAKGNDVRTVMVDGCLLMADRQLFKIDQKEVCTETENRAKRIAEAVG